MAGQGPQDPDRIDISLDLVGEGSLVAMQQLSDQLAALTEHLSQFGSGVDTAAQAQAGVARRGRTRAGTGISEGGPSRTASISGTGAPSDAAGLNASMPTPRQRVGRLFRTPGSALISEAQEYGQREALQHLRRQQQGLPDYDLAGIGGTGGGYGYNFGNSYMGGYVDGPTPSGVSPTASLPQPTGQPVWRNALRGNPSAWEQMQEGVRLPPGGLSMNIQDKLRLASNFLGSLAERQYQQGLAEAQSVGFTEEEFNLGMAQNGEQVGLRKGVASVLLRQASESNLLAGLQGIGMDAHRFGRAAYAYGSGLQNAGVQAGFERAGQISIGGFGITNPFSFFKGGSAMREALNQRINVQRLRLMGGIDKDQANAIVGGLAGLGWTGEEGQNVAFDAIAPLVQQGQNPEIVTGLFDQAVRNGNTSLQEFRNTMNNLGPAARAARMTLDEYQQSLGQFAEWAEQHGARFLQGAQLGRDLSTGFGMAPQQVQQFAESPFTQSMAMSRFGILPNEIAAMGGANVAGMISQGVDFAMQAAAPLAQDVVDPNTGRVVLRGDRRQRIQAAQFLGVNVQSLDQMLNAQKMAPHMFRAQDLLKEYNAKGNALKRAREQDRKKGVSVSTGRGGGVSQTSIPTGKDRMDDASFEAGQRELEGDWRSIESELTRLAPGRPGDKGDKARVDFFKQLRDMRDDSPQERQKKAQELMKSAARRATEMPDENEVKVRFTGAAAKWFEQQESKLPKSAREANAGGRPINEVATQGRETDYLELFRSMYGGG